MNSPTTPLLPPCVEPSAITVPSSRILSGIITSKAVPYPATCSGFLITSPGAGWLIFTNFPNATHPELRFSATLGREPEVELELV